MFLVELCQKLYAKGHFADSLLIWVDAICIAQDQGSENHDQIRLMGDIYQRAVQVVAWLGPVSDRSLEVALALKKNPDLRTARLGRQLPSKSEYATSQLLLEITKCSY